jgi:septal ring factor EnvC (AmiA/AmiB activator)
MRAIMEDKQHTLPDQTILKKIEEKLTTLEAKLTQTEAANQKLEAEVKAIKVQ